jgi:methionyl-tRNA formyltransferase
VRRPIGGYVLAAIPKRGEIRIHEDDTPVVHGVGADAVDLLEVAPAGRKRMSGAEWARGARIQPGEQLT